MPIVEMYVDKCAGDKVTVDEVSIDTMHVDEMTSALLVG